MAKAKKQPKRKPLPEPDWEDTVVGIIKDIDAAVLQAESLSQFNTLAITLFIRSIDILSAQYPEKQILHILSFLYRDRKAKRAVPTTLEYAEAAARAEAWLPK